MYFNIENDSLRKSNHGQNLYWPRKQIEQINMGLSRGNMKLNMKPLATVVVLA